MSFMKGLQKMFTPTGSPEEARRKKVLRSFMTPEAAALADRIDGMMQPAANPAAPLSTPSTPGLVPPSFAMPIAEIRAQADASVPAETPEITGPGGASAMWKKLAFKNKFQR